MIIDTAVLSKEDEVYLELQCLYERAGYSRFKMRKFEEYSLYLENKNFLGSESVITFNDPSGKLLALKPDVTLSIVKNAKAAEKFNEKVYYRESVYRRDKQSNEFTEINQLGLEFIGDADAVQTVEVCSLALKSLRAIDSDFVFALSHMGYVTGLTESLGIQSKGRREILKALGAKNAREIDLLCDKFGVADDRKTLLIGLAESPTEFSVALKEAKSGLFNRAMKDAAAELEKIYSAFENTEFKDKVRLDFSVMNDIDYYNGIIFQGFVAGYPKMILSGGRYDGLLEKFRKKIGAMGFALYLKDLNVYYPKRGCSAETAELLYGDGDDVSVIERAEELRNEGKALKLTKSPAAVSDQITEESK